MNDLRMELKVCEGCGALWLRSGQVAGQVAGVYCRGCSALLAEFPAPLGRRRTRVAARAAVRRTGLRTGPQVVPDAVVAGGAR